MDSNESSGTPGRRRGAGINEVASEDQALDMIAREAEARLAAKRAARAEARSIRMKEIERRQNEAEDDVIDETDVIERVHVRKNTRNGSIVMSSFDTADSVSQTLSKDEHILHLKEMLKDREVRYNKAMVSAAQLDNEKQALQYQLGAMKDIIEELQENVDDKDDELADKCRDLNKLSREFQTTTSELNKCLFLLEERDRVLEEHGINADGTFKEGYGPAEKVLNDTTLGYTINCVDSTIRNNNDFDEKCSIDHSSIEML